MSPETLAAVPGGADVMNIVENAPVAAVAIVVLFIFYKFGMKALDIIADLKKSDT